MTSARTARPAERWTPLPSRNATKDPHFDPASVEALFAAEPVRMPPELALHEVLDHELV